jgi:hypothetical protein
MLEGPRIGAKSIKEVTFGHNCQPGPSRGIDLENISCYWINLNQLFLLKKSYKLDFIK